MTTTNDDHNMNMNLVAEMPESDEAYRAHRVVAFPSRGRVSVREAVSTHNVKTPSNTQKPRPRSLSTGKTRTRPQDLVQEVYDRMGLHIKRTDPSGSMVACNNSVYATKTSTTSNTRVDHYGVYSDRTPAPVRCRGERAPTEGGGADKATTATTATPDVYQERERILPDELRRSRSLSRGRLVAMQWPPPTDKEEVMGTPPGSPVGASKQQTPTRTPLGHNATTNVSLFPLEAFPSWKPSAKEWNDEKKVALERSPSYKTSAKEWNDEKKEDDEPSEGDEYLMNELLKVTPPSVKDRASLFGGADNKPKPKLNNRNTVRSSHDAQYAAQFAVREKPPKVNVYGNARGVAEGDEQPMKEQREDDTGRGSTTGQSVESAAADCGAEHPPQIKRNNRNSEANSATSHPPQIKRSSRKSEVNSAASPTPSSRSTKSTGNVASAFLASLQNPKPPQEQIPRNKHSTTAPMEEISASSDPAVGNDSASVGMSSVSNDEFAPIANRFSGGVARKPSWQERNRVSAYGAGMNNNVGKSSNNVASEDIEKIIDERVQAQFQKMESRMEASLQRWMHKMDEKTMGRLDVMEEKINGIYNSLQMEMPTYY